MQYFQKELETMSADQKKVLQSERLVKMVKYVYENQKPYRAKMDAMKLKPEDIKSIDDIYKLPFTVKQDLRDAYPFGMMARPRRDLVRLHASSATTGKLTVARRTEYLRAGAAAYRLKYGKSRRGRKPRRRACLRKGIIMPIEKRPPCDGGAFGNRRIRARLSGVRREKNVVRLRFARRQRLLGTAFKAFGEIYRLV